MCGANKVIHTRLPIQELFIPFATHSKAAGQCHHAGGLLTKRPPDQEPPLTKGFLTKPLTKGLLTKISFWV